MKVVRVLRVFLLAILVNPVFGESTNRFCLEDVAQGCSLAYQMGSEIYGGPGGIGMFPRHEVHWMRLGDREFLRLNPHLNAIGQHGIAGRCQTQYLYNQAIQRGFIDPRAPMGIALSCSAGWRAFFNAPTDAANYSSCSGAPAIGLERGLSLRVCPNTGAITVERGSRIVSPRFELHQGGCVTSIGNGADYLTPGTRINDPSVPNGYVHGNGSRIPSACSTSWNAPSGNSLGQRLGQAARTGACNSALFGTGFLVSLSGRLYGEEWAYRCGVDPRIGGQAGSIASTTALNRCLGLTGSKALGSSCASAWGASLAVESVKGGMRGFQEAPPGDGFGICFETILGAYGGFGKQVGWTAAQGCEIIFGWTRPADVPPPADDLWFAW